MREIRPVWTFFYGSYMNFGVLQEVDLAPERFEVAKLPGFDIQVGPLANLVPSEQHSVYGVVATATPPELRRLYTHAQEVLGGIYDPEAVLVETVAGDWRPALCYISHDMAPAPPRGDYLERIIAPASKFAFPPWYLERLESFRTSTRSR